MFLGTRKVFFWEEPRVVLQLVLLILRAHLEFEAHFLLPPPELLILRERLHSVWTMKFLRTLRIFAWLVIYHGIPY